MKDLQKRATEHLATKIDVEQVASRLIKKMSDYHRNTIIWVVSTVATGVTITVGLISLAIRYL